MEVVRATAAPLAVLVIAVDGPSGAGKSSVARGVATRLGLRYLDTGSTYRAVTWRVLRRGVDVDDAGQVASAALDPVVEVGTDPAEPTICVDGIDVSGPIRSGEVTAAVSAVSAVPAVRERLAALQREIIGTGGIVVEGRDIGTVVAPDAQVKVFLTADPTARAQRRGLEVSADQSATLADLARRDRLDSGRATAPLAKAADAHEIDATHLSLPQVIDAVLALVRRSTDSAAAGSSAAELPVITDAPTPCQQRS